MVKLVITTTDSISSARTIALKLVESGDAACVNILQVSESVYKWEGNIQQQREFLLLCKTSDSGSGRLFKSIEKLHPYEVPEILEISTSSVSEKYEKWINESCGI